MGGRQNCKNYHSPPPLLPTLAFRTCSGAALIRLEEAVRFAFQGPKPSVSDPATTASDDGINNTTDGASSDSKDPANNLESDPKSPSDTAGKTAGGTKGKQVSLVGGAGVSTPVAEAAGGTLATGDYDNGDGVASVPPTETISGTLSPVRSEYSVAGSGTDKKSLPRVDPPHADQSTTSLENSTANEALTGLTSPDFAERAGAASVLSGETLPSEAVSAPASAPASPPEVGGGGERARESRKPAAGTKKKNRQGASGQSGVVQGGGSAKKYGHHLSGKKAGNREEEKSAAAGQEKEGGGGGEAEVEPVALPSHVITDDYCSFWVREQHVCSSIKCIEGDVTIPRCFCSFHFCLFVCWRGGVVALLRWRQQKNIEGRACCTVRFWFLFLVVAIPSCQ